MGITPSWHAWLTLAGGTTLCKINGTNGFIKEKITKEKEIYQGKTEKLPRKKTPRKIPDKTKNQGSEGQGEAPSTEVAAEDRSSSNPPKGTPPQSKNPCKQTSGHESRGNKRDKLNGTNGAKFAVFRRFSLIFADFRVPWEL